MTRFLTGFRHGGEVWCGLTENRLAEDGLDYVASYADLIAAFGSGQTLADIRAAGVGHYAGGGRAEGRRDGIDFDGGQYLANNADLAAAFGSDDDLAAFHFIKNGFAEGRLWENPLAYVASHADLVAAFKTLDQAAIETAGITHFRNQGFTEGRRASIDFDAEAYLANYEDLRSVFGADENAATLHFIQFGFTEGRTDTLLG